MLAFPLAYIFIGITTYLRNVQQNALQEWRQ